MGTKQKISEDKIIASYMDYVLESNTEHITIYAFCKSINIEEGDFYQYFGNFEAIEKKIFLKLYENSLETINKSEQFSEMDAQNKLLLFYFTFIENMTLNRSYLLYQLSNVSDFKKLGAIRKPFQDFIQALDFNFIELNNETIDKIQSNSIKEAAWVQLLSIVKFWKEDSSAQFEKTDLYIEKSVKAGFDLINATPLKSLFDLGKFIYKEKSNN